MARKGSGFDPDNPAGKTIGASRATIASDWLDANLAGTATIKLYTGQQEQLHRDLAAVAWMPCSATAWAHTLGFRVRRAPVLSSSAWNTGWTKVSASRVRHEDAALLLRLNDALKAVLANGTYERINARYFPFSIY